jgi:hypothetical protein
MVAQTVLTFKLESTAETLTAHGGLVLVGEYIHALGLPAWIDRDLPAPGSGAGYAPSAYVLPIVLMLHGGGRSLEDLRHVRGEVGLGVLLGLGRIPSSDAVGDWLRRMGAGVGLQGVGDVHRRLMRKLLKKDKRKRYTLDIDATQIVAEKQAASWTYKGEKGYMPLVGHLDNDLVIGEVFREGNAAPAGGNLEFIQHCETQLPTGKRIGAVRADSAAYQAAIINYCEAGGKRFAIGADLDAAVKQSIAAIAESAWRRWRDGEIAETVHCMNATNKAFRLIVVRRARQGELFDEPGACYHYTVIASNRQESAAATMDWYCQRGEASENRIKDLKGGFGMERMPCGQFEANAMFFRLGVLAYNLFVGFKRWALKKEWRRHQVQTVRWRLYQTAGKIVRHAGQLYLKVSQQAREVFGSIRARCWALAVEGTT